MGAVHSKTVCRTVMENLKSTTGSSVGGPWVLAMGRGVCPPPWSCGEKITIGELRKEGIFPLLTTDSKNIV